MRSGRTSHLHVVFCLAVGLSVPSPAAAAGAADPAPVLGGQPAPPGKWPDVAAVMDGDVAFCTGTLVAPRVVITAGHCVDGPTEPTDVKLGATDSTGPGEVIAIEEAIEFLNWENTYDIAVLILAEPSTIAPRTVATTCVTRESLVNGAPITLVGYGATTEEGDDPNTTLMEGQAAIVDATCSAGAGCQPAVSPGGEFVAGGQGVDSCFGDSGGPVYLNSRHDGIVLAGVVSRPLDDAATPCGDGGIYVRPDDLINWIELAARERIQAATCTPPVEDPPDDGDDDGDEGSGDDGDGASGDDGATGDGLDDTAPGTVTGGCSAGGRGTGTAALVLLLALLRLSRATPTCRRSRPRPSAGAWPCRRRGSGC